LSVFPPLIPIYAMLSNNNHGEIFDTISYRINFPYIFEIYAVYFLSSFLLMFPCALTLAIVHSAIKKAS